MPADTRNGGRLFAVLGKSLAWGLGTAVASALATLAVFAFIMPRLVDAPGLSAQTFAVMAGHGGFFIGLLLGLLLQIPTVLPLSPWHQGVHIVCVLLCAVLAWATTDVALRFSRSSLGGHASNLSTLGTLTATEYRSLSGQCPGGQLTTLSPVGSVRQSA
jgi:hypothetical protein